jgi:hypothetical protein
MKRTLGIALMLAAAAPLAHAERTLDAAGGTAFVTTIDGTRAVEIVRAADGTQVRVEVIPAGASAPSIHRISHTRGGRIVHGWAEGSATLTTSLFRYGTADASYTATAYLLRDARTGTILRPDAVRTIVLDPADAGATLLDASHVYLPRTDTPRALAVVQRSSGEAVLLDYDVAGGPVRRTPLGFTAPIGSNKGSFVGTPDGRVWAALASTAGIRLFDLGDLSSPVAPLQPVPKAVIAGGPGFDPESTHLGIIAILIGVVSQPTPAVSYQRGGELIVSALDGASLRAVVRQDVPADSSALIEDEGLFYFFWILPYIEQENLYRTPIGEAAEEEARRLLER